MSAVGVRVNSSVLKLEYVGDLVAGHVSIILQVQLVYLYRVMNALTGERERRDRLPQRQAGPRNHPESA